MPPPKSNGYIQVYTLFFFGEQTQQCLVWNVFKEKANFAECEYTDVEIVLFQKNMRRFRALVDSEDLHFICHK